MAEESHDGCLLVVFSRFCRSYYCYLAKKNNPVLAVLLTLEPKFDKSYLLLLFCHIVESLIHTAAPHRVFSKSA